MKTYVDLTEPILENHWRYQSFIQEREVVDESNNTKIEKFMNIGHAFTHIDCPKHMNKSGKLLEECNLFSFLIGKASILDISDIKPNEAINAQRLMKAFEGCDNTDFLIIKTAWGVQHSSTTKEFWTEAPYLTRHAVEYLKSLKPKVVGFDFPQDYGIRIADLDSDLANRDPNCKKVGGDNAPAKPTPENSPSHFFLLPYDHLMIEYMTNLWNVPVKNVDIYALPLKLRTENADGAPIRVIAAY